MTEEVASTTPNVTMSFAPSESLVHHTSPSVYQPITASRTGCHGQGRQRESPANTARSPRAISARRSTGSNSPMLILPIVKNEVVPVESRREASMPPTASTIGERPEYTVTSPPMSPPPPAAHEMSHRVEQTEDYVPPTTETAEATVLVRVKDGDEYKLALNMQQFSPEDITIKLNGQELSIEASNGGESFKQKHVIPDNIDLDAMSSSFSSDGVLVIKAPKK